MFLFQLEVLSFLLMIIIFNVVKAECDFVDYRRILPGQDTKFMTEIQIPKIVTNPTQNIGFGFWMRFLPFKQQTTQAQFENDDQRQFFLNQQEDQNLKFKNREKQFICSLVNKISNKTILIHQQKINFINQTFDHEIMLNLNNINKNITFIFDKNFYEGGWIMFYIYFDLYNGFTTIGLWQRATNQWQTEKIADHPQFAEVLELRLGWYDYQTFFENKYYLFDKFIGQLTNVFTTSSKNIYETGIQKCLDKLITIDKCTQPSNMLISYNVQFKGDRIQQSYIPYVNIQRFYFYFWAKLDELQQESFRESVIFRITTNQKYNDELLIGDKLLYLKYFQNLKQQLNGFTMTTNSYVFPALNEYTIQPDDIIQSFDAYFYQLFIQWHVIQFEKGTMNNNGKPLLRIFSPKYGEFQFFWPNDKKYFTFPELYFYFGGDKYSSTYLKGYLSNFVYQSLCSQKAQKLIIVCHYSCVTCNGPTFQNCLTCNEANNRQYEQMSHSCPCKHLYFDFYEYEVCFSVVDFQMAITKVEYQLFQQSQQQIMNVDKDIFCLVGYVQFQNYCIQCPYYEYLQIKIQILCADCYLYPEKFLNNLKCTFDLISFDQQKDNVYDIVYRELNSIENFQISKEFRFIQIINNNICQEGYFMNENKCYQCQLGCKDCNSQNSCLKCSDNYYLTEYQTCQTIENCQKLIKLSNFKLLCEICDDQYYLYNNNCIKCGDNCQSCNIFGQCNYCIDQQKFHIAFDRINCKVCQIKNCKHCFFFYYQQQQIYTTLDQNFQVQDSDFSSYQEGCALCDDGYFFNFITLNCSFKCQNILNNQEANKCLNDFKDCSFGIINTSGQSYCIKSQNSINSISYQNCNLISNCKECFNSEQLKNNQQQCIVCNEGYYYSSIENKCLFCQSNCQICIQQNKKYNNYWKQSIQAFYILLYSDQTQFSYGIKKLYDFNYEFEIICIQCKFGYILYNNQCIEDCDQSCQECIIKDGKSKCIKCFLTDYGYLRSLTQNKCNECPLNCAVCYERSQESIISYNPYFIINNENQKNTRQCIELYSNQNSKYQYLDTSSFLQTQCDQYELCHNKYQYRVNVYCNFDDYETNMVSGGFNVFLDAFFTQTEFTYEDIIADVLSQELAKEVEMLIKFIQGSSTSCLIKYNFFIYTLIQQKVFSIKKLHMHMFAETETTLLLEQKFSIYNFTSVTFTNITFKFLESKNNKQEFYQIYFETISQNSTLNLFNCKFTSDKRQIKFHFDMRNVQNLIIQNLIFEDFLILNSEFFSMNLHSISNLEISKLDIKNSYFQNSKLFLLKDSSTIVNYKINITLLTIQSTFFYSSYFLYIESYLLIKQESLIKVNKIVLDKIYLDNSILFREPSCIDFSINNLLIKNTNFSISYFIQTFCLILNNSIISNIEINSSSLLSNYFEINYNKIQVNNIIASVQFNNLTIYNIITDNQQPFINLQQQDMNYTFTVYFKFINFQNILSILINQQHYDHDLNSTFIYLECKICQLSEINIDKSYDIIEFAIVKSQSIELNNVQAIQSQQRDKKILCPTDECINHILKLYPSFLLIQFYQNIIFNNISFTNCLILNKPLIQIIGYAKNSLILNESINIKNSIFQNNTIILSDQNKQISIMQILTAQICQINIFNVTFQGNILNQFVQNFDTLNSLTLLIDAQFGIISFKDSNILNNLVLNTSNTVLFIKSQAIYLQNSVFSNNNNLMSSNICNILFENKISEESLFKYFPILSQGGNGKIISNEIVMQQIFITASYAEYGGAFVIKTNGDGRIIIDQSIFQDIGVSLKNSSDSKGGCLYIDSSKSNLNFNFTNSVIRNTYSLKQGGALYVIPSQSENFISFHNVSIEDCFSLQTKFLFFELPFQNNIVSQVQFKQINILQTQNGFESFLMKINDQIKSLVSSFFEYPIIYLKYGNILMEQIYCNNNYLSYFVQIDQGSEVIIKDLSIQNCQFFNSPLLKISLFRGKNIQQQLESSNYIYFENVKLQNNQFFNEIKISQCNLFQQHDIKLIDCQQSTSQSRIAEVDYQNINYKQNSLNCNKNLIFLNSQFNQFNLIYLEITHSNQSIILTNIKMKNQICETCESGILHIDLNIVNQQVQIQLNELLFKNNSCGKNGCLYISTNDQKQVNRILQNNNLKQNETRKINLESIFNEAKLSKSVSIQSSLFLNNIAQFGGALFINQTSTLIYQSQLLNNSAQIGGAIYFISKNNNQIQLINSLITNNFAKIAGGVQLTQDLLGLTQQLNVQIFDNNSTQFGNDISENPRQLTLSMDGGKMLLQKTIMKNKDTEFYEKIKIDPYYIYGTNKLSQYLMLPSGIPINQYSIFDEQNYQMVPLNLTFRIIALNKFNQIEKLLNNSQCTLSSQVFDINNGSEANNLQAQLSKTKYSFNTSTQDYNMDDLIINFNPLLIDNYFLRITIQCEIVKVPYFQIEKNNIITTQIKQYKLFVDIQTFPCQPGEYLNQQTGACIQCDASQNLYSLIQNSLKCTYKDDISINNMTSSMIQLKINYWRANNHSSKIEYCYNKLDVCLGGWLPGDDSCSQGHIGALCEQCDIYNIRNQGSYSLTSQYQCSNCSNILKNTIIIILIFIWLIVTLQTSVNSTIQKNKEFIITSKLKFTVFLDSFQHAQKAIIIKLFTNYFQLISSIQSFQLQIPQEIAILQQSLGNPVKQASYSFDCFLIYFTIVDVNYFRIIWMILYIVIVMILFFGLGIIDYFINKTILQSYKIYTALIYLFIYLQPSIIGSLIAQLSYRNISDKKWISGNPSKIYDTETHLKWMIYFIIPFTLLFGVIIPLFLFIKIHSNKHRLNFSTIRQNFGYLINEYKQQAYYWDIIKLIQKELIILVLTYYQDFVSVKASLIVLLLFFYCLFQSQIKPYLSHSLNQLDGKTMKICAYSLILGSCIHSAQDFYKAEIVWISYLIITILNTILCLNFIIEILKAFFKQLDQFLEKLISFTFFYCPLIFHSSIQKYLFKKNDQRQNIKARFMKLKVKLLPFIKDYIQFKKVLQQNSQISLIPQRELYYLNTCSDDGSSQINPKTSGRSPDIIKLFLTKNTQRLAIRRNA